VKRLKQQREIDENLKTAALEIEIFLRKRLKGIIDNTKTR